MVACLQIMKGDSVGTRAQLAGDKTVIGRHPGCDLVLDDAAVSRHHSQITANNGSYWLEDLKSRNGTNVNGSTVEGRVQLRPGDVIGICSTLLRFCSDDFSQYGQSAGALASVAPLVAAGGLKIPDYLAPEQIDERPDQPVTAAVDLHAVGVMMYQMITAELPLPEGEVAKVMAIGNRRFASAVKRSSELGLDSKLASLIDTCLQGGFREPTALRESLRTVRRNEGIPEPRRESGSRRIIPPASGEQFRVVRLLFEDDITEAFEAVGEISKERFTLRLFKPAFQSPKYVDLVRSLVSAPAAFNGTISPGILLRFQAGYAQPLPVRPQLLIAVRDDPADDAALCLVEQFAGNRSLHALISEEAPLTDAGRVLNLIDQILDGLEYAHNRGCIHANLTPYCIFVDTDDRVRIEGFGLHASVEAMRADAGGDSMMLSSVASSVVHTPSGRLSLKQQPEASLRCVLEVIRDLTSRRGLQELLDGLLESLFQTFPQAEEGAVLLCKGTSRQLEVSAARSRTGSIEHIRISRIIVSQAIRNREALLSADAAMESDDAAATQSVSALKISSLMCSPLLAADEEPLGVLVLKATHLSLRFREDELQLLTTVATAASTIIALAMHYEDSLANREVERERACSDHLRLQFFPRTLPVVDGYSLADYYSVGTGSKGCFYDCVRLPGSSTAVAIGEISGHDFGAAAAQVTLYPAIRNQLLFSHSPARVLDCLNASLNVSAGQDRMAPMTLAVLDPRQHTLKIAVAGHSAPLLRKNSGSVVPAIAESGGLPLGIVRATYDEIPCLIKPGETVLLFSNDVVSGVTDPDGQPYSLDRLTEAVSRGPADPDGLIDAITADIDNFTAGQQQAGCICLVGIHRRELVDKTTSP